MRRNTGREGLSKLALGAVTLAIAGCQPSANTPSQNGGARPITAFFTPTQASMGRPFYARRIAEQADPDVYGEGAKRLRFKLESDATHIHAIANDEMLPPRSEWAVPMGVVNGSLAVLTSRCLIDYKYPLREGQPDPNFRNLALFDAEGRFPRSVFMLAPIGDRPELTAFQDPRRANAFDTDRHYLNGPVGDRYFGALAPGQLPRVGAQLLPGDNWGTNIGIDLVMLYFPLIDPDVVTALSPSNSLGVQDPMGVVQAAMQGRTDYLETFSFSMITPQCLHAAEADLQHAEHEAKLWKGIAVVAAAAFVLPLLGPALAPEGGLAGFAGHMATALEQGVGPKILSGLAPAAWRVTQRVLSGQQLADVVWDEGGHLVIGAVVDSFPRRLTVAGVRRGTADNDTAAGVLATVREFVRDRAGQLLIQSAGGHADVASVVSKEFGVDLATELLTRGLVALDADDRQTLARQPTLLRAAAFALQGNRGPAVLDPRYQAAIQQLAALAGS